MNKLEGSSDEFPPRDCSSMVTAVALSGNKKSKHIVKWALDKFVPEGRVFFVLLHVRPVVNRIPTPMGNFLPISHARDEVAAAFMKDVDWEVTETLLPYKQMCVERKVEVEVVQIESDDVASAISSHIRKRKIVRLVIGSSSQTIFSRGQALSSKISEACPSFCSVYAVSKGKLTSLRSYRSEDCSETSSSTNLSFTNTCSSLTDSMSSSFSNFRSDSLPAQRFQALSVINQALLQKRSTPSAVITNRGNSPPSIASDGEDDLDFKEDQQESIDMDLEKLRIELRHIRGMYAMAQGEAIDASNKIDELEKQHLEEKMNLKRAILKEKEAREMARLGKERYEAVMKESKFVNESVERETYERRDAEARTLRKAKERENLENALDGSSLHYREFTWDEIVTATSSFSEDLKIGMGAYGTVYKGSFHHTTAAVKVLRSKESKQFRQELEILSKIRHPHLLILLGACNEKSCLVYEFMENGSLEERLLRKKNIDASPLTWRDRFRIAWEIASALVFLHSAKPNSIVHRDLKPSNILLDRNLVSKIGDVGLSTMLDEKDPFALSSNHKETALAGTLCYIDPEYQRTGVITAKSDIYAFGVVVLQLLTGRSAVALAPTVETAVEENRLGEVLDRAAGPWPAKEARELAHMALRCTELRRRDRPDLRAEVLPFLEKVKGVAEEGRALEGPPSHFVCPILKEVMSEPCVAGDGYTYDRKAIEEWLVENDCSPVTELPLPHKLVVPNYTLLSAIMEWKSGI